MAARCMACQVYRGCGRAWMARRMEAAMTEGEGSVNRKPVRPSAMVSRRPPVARASGMAPLAHGNHLRQAARFVARVA